MFVRNTYRVLSGTVTFPVVVLCKCYYNKINKLHKKKRNILYVNDRAHYTNAIRSFFIVRFVYGM